MGSTRYSALSTASCSPRLSEIGLDMSWYMLDSVVHYIDATRWISA